uniref:Xanthine dehydrogenase small subunit n=1 Tax=Candidatus Kentrum sp. MB TaxID=2138164 RepID=A0A450XJ61_9GAMM|nr:MAG: xanthine dehydrogenase small subunit [Candidatus Kentron sp. MB]
MIDFILNDRNIRTEAPFGGVVLDFLRHSERLTGVKESCREGACGSCLILLGQLDGDSVSYRSVNSCLLPLAEIEGKHVVTIEGLNQDQGELTPIQQAIVAEGATQCGYCTPGIILALTGFFLGHSHFDKQKAIAAVSGNLCRCTGYQSIKRAINWLCGAFSPSDSHGGTHMDWLVDQKILPDYFLQIPRRLRELPTPRNVPLEISSENIIVGGGTDLWVRKPDQLTHADLIYLSRRKELKGIRIEKGYCHIGAATTFEELKESSIMQDLFPKIREYFSLIASEPIRCRATVGGNIVNASPIGDITIFLLALDTSITLNAGQNQRKLALKDFFKSYKKLDKQDTELMEEISFPLPTRNTHFNFEKVSKSTHLDIASVNSAIQITMDNGIIRQIHLSAGGIASTPFYLSNTTHYLIGKEINPDSVREAGSIAQSETSPISDVRGSADYKRLLLRQLIYAHFITLFPDRITFKALR